MKYRIMITIKATGNNRILMTGIKGLFEADRLARMFKAKNPGNTYFIVNEANGDIEGGEY